MTTFGVRDWAIPDQGGIPSAGGSWRTWYSRQWTSTDTHAENWTTTWNVETNRENMDFWNEGLMAHFQNNAMLMWPGEDWVYVYGTNEGLDVVDDEVDAVPAAGPRLLTVGHGPTCRAPRPGEQQTQSAALHVGERGRCTRQDLETEVLGGERDRFVHVVDHVANVDRLVIWNGSPPGRTPSSRSGRLRSP